MPRISIIMPVYNGARFLSQSIESVLAQTYPDWELIVIDDGSTDSSPEILERFADHRIRIYRQVNGGEARARNAGLDRVRGEYVAFLDSDDQFLPEALEEFVNFLDEHAEFDVLYSDGFLCDRDNRRLSRLTEHRAGLDTGNILERIVLSPAIITVPVCTAFRYAAVRKSGIRFDPEVGYGTDWDFWTQLAVHARFGYLDKVTCLYRIHENNMTSSATIEKRKSDLVKGRIKVLNASWFGGLSTYTREKFFYLLVIELLTDSPEKQIEIMASTQARRLSTRYQALLFGWIGIETLQRQGDKQLGQSFFRRALQVSPTDFKARVMLILTHFPLPLVLLLVRMWRSSYRVIEKLRSRGAQNPKPLPAQYGPISTSTT